MVLCCCQSAVGGEGGHTLDSGSGTQQLSKHADTLLYGKNQKLRSASTECLHNTMKHAASTKGSQSVLKRLIAAVCINPDYARTVETHTGANEAGRRGNNYERKGLASLSRDQVKIPIVIKNV